MLKPFLVVLGPQNNNLLHFGPLRYQLKTLQYSSYGVWEGRSSQIVKKRYFWASKMKLPYGFMIVNWMFLGNFGDVKTIFYSFCASKWKHFAFWAFGRPIQNSLIRYLWDVGGLFIKKWKSVIYELQKWSLLIGSGL